MNKNAMEEAIQNVLCSGIWGTIGAKSLESAKLLADEVGAAYGLLTFSTGAALEGMLRSLEGAHGDTVLLKTHTSPILAQMVCTVGLMPQFLLDTADLAKVLKENGKIRALLLDIYPGQTENLREIGALCKENSVSLLLYAHGFFSFKQEGKFPCEYADAAVYALDENSEVDCGGVGLAVTNSKARHTLHFAYHNCGRAFGEGSSLNCDAYVGGDLRVTEWHSVLVPFALQNRKQATLPELADLSDFTADLKPMHI